MIITKRIPSRFTCPDLPELRASTTAATQRRSPRAERAIEPSAMREQLKNPAASVGNRAPAHGGEGSGGVLSSVYCSLPLAADRARKPPTLSSLTDEEHVGSLLRSTAARDPVRATTTAADSRCSRRRSAGGDGEQCFFVSSTPTKTVATQRTSPRAERAIRTERDARAAEESSCERRESRAGARRRRERRRSFLCLLLAPARCGSRQEAAYFVVAHRRRACRLAPPQHGGARSGASDDDDGGFSMFAPPICRRRWRNNAFSVSSAPTKTAATQRRSPRAERAIEPSAMREQLKNPAASVGNRAPAHG